MALSSLEECRGYDWAGTEPALLLYPTDLQGMVGQNSVCQGPLKITAGKACHGGAW